jgi:hypothetical protein
MRQNKLQTVSTRAAERIPATGKHIEQAGPFDFDMYIDGCYVGSRPTRAEARAELDQLMLDYLTHAQGIAAARQPAAA